MPVKCSAFGCQSGYDTTLRERGNEGVSFFRIPRDQVMRQTFVRRMKLGRELTDKDRICSKHFSSSDIKWKHDDVLINGHCIPGSPLKNPELKKGAVPHIFPGCPAYMTTVHTGRPAPKKRQCGTEESCQSAQESQTNMPDPPHLKRNDESNASPNQSTVGGSIITDSNQDQNNESEEPIVDGAANFKQPAQGHTKKKPPKSPEADGVVSHFDVKSINLPSKQWVITEAPTKEKTYCIVKINERMRVGCGIRLSKDKIEVEINEIPLLGLGTEICDNTSLEQFIKRVDTLKACEGYNGNRGKHCTGWLTNFKPERCLACKRMKKTEYLKERRIFRKQLEAKKSSTLVRKQRIQNFTRQVKRNQSQVKELRKKIRNLKEECKNIEVAKLKDLISDLPQEQQDLVLACQARAKANGANGRRYDLKWVYECILMRIKSPTLYNHLRVKNILPLPCRATVNRYMRKLHPMYGFQDTLFAALTKKISGWPPRQRHGNILIDEMKLQPGLEFDRHILAFWGLVNLGENTPDNLKEEMGDHALVIQFVPFAAKYNQVLACFLSKGNVKGAELAKIVLEAVNLSENAGFLVDAITSDGAGWNHNMWKEFGVSPERPYCTQPCDDNRKLWFFSDWCHLLKCMRNNLCPLPPKKKSNPKIIATATQAPTRKQPAPQTSAHPAKKTKLSVGKKDNEQQLKPVAQKRPAPKSTAADTTNPPKQPRLHVQPQNKQELQNPNVPLQSETTSREVKVAKPHLFKTLHTPDGLVQRQHWLCLWREEEKRQKLFNLRSTHRISAQTVYPSGFQRMNVGQAYKFFSSDVAEGMRIYRRRKTYGFKDSEPTENFILRISKLAKAMNSGKKQGALHEDSVEEKTIEEFLTYHQECIRLAKENGRSHFWSERTDCGLSVTLKSTLELARYLRKELGLQYVMTKRFNQDALEQFFANIRRAAAPNPHPDPKLFAQLFRLLCMYSLVSPIKGSNVRGVENVEALLNTEDVKGAEIKDRVEKYEQLLDEILIYGKPFKVLEKNQHDDHNYNNASVDREINQFMAGFTAAKLKTFVGTCEKCLTTIIKPREEANEDDIFTLDKEEFGGYTLPTQSLANLICALECAALDCVAKHKVHADFLFTVLNYVNLSPSCFVGCLDHISDVTKKMMKFYLTTRMFFVGDQATDHTIQTREQGKNLRKQAKNLKLKGEGNAESAQKTEDDV